MEEKAFSVDLPDRWPRVVCLVSWPFNAAGVWVRVGARLAAKYSRPVTAPKTGGPGDRETDSDNCYAGQVLDASPDDHALKEKFDSSSIFVIY